MNRCEPSDSKHPEIDPAGLRNDNATSLFEQLSHKTHADCRLIYQLTQRGFTSEINNLLLAILYSLENRMEFRLSSRFWGAAYEKGWTDYFHPFCKESNNRLTRIGTITRLPEKIERRQKLYKLLRPGTLFTHDIWDATQSPEFLSKVFVFPELGINGNIFQAKRALLSHVFRLTPTTKRSIDKLGMAPPEAYVAFHIRRGDKLVSEAKAVEVDKYMLALQAIRNDIKHIYLATDDHAVVKELQSKYKDYIFYSLCPENQSGYRQSSFNTADLSHKKTETLRLLADIQNIQGAEIFIGTFSSNIGRLIALLKGIENCISLDEEWHPL